MTDEAATAGFETHTAIESDGVGEWWAEIDPQLSGFGGIHGGYLAAIALRAMTTAVTDPERRPRSLSLHIHSPVRAGRAELRTRVMREGSTTTAVSLGVMQEGATVASGLASFGRSRTSPTHDSGGMPDVPALDKCKPISEKPVPEAGAGYLVEHRPAMTRLPFSGGDHAEILVWMRLIEDRALDALSATTLADAAPPALYMVLREFVAMPTIDLTVHFGEIGKGASPWVLGVFRTRRAAAGYAVEDGDLWSPDGALILHSRQLRRILTDERT